MKIPNHNKTDYPGYPGLYEPVRANHPPINITEAEGMYKIDFSIPGFKREQIFIEAKGDRLFIEAGNQKEPPYKKESCRSMEYDYEYIRREVVVPGNVDTNFLSAEYKDGILSICMFQTESIIQNDIVEIAVY